MRESMAQLTPRFSSNRSVREYTERYYLPAAAAYRERAANGGRGGAQIVAWQRRLAETWPGLRLSDVQRMTDEEGAVIEVRVELHGLDPEAVQVELYAEAVDGGAPVRQEMARVWPVGDAADGVVYRARLSTGRPVTDFTPRVVPRHAGVAVPLEEARIVWPS